MRESKVQTKIISWLKKNGWFVLKIIQLSDNGYPDVYAYKEGRTVWFECKKTGVQKGEALQEVRIDYLRKIGMEAYVVDSLEDVKKYIACK
ncbi:hypothetical protein GCM10009415_49760 [Chitinophaga japonensis]